LNKKGEYKNMINTGKEIRRLRLSKNMTQIDLAE